MSIIQRLSVIVLVTLLIAVVPMQGSHFSAWVTPINLGPVVNSTSGDFFPAISKNGLSLYFTSPRPGGFGGWDIYVSQRASVDELWGAPQNLGPTINTSFNEGAPSLSVDGHYMFFASTRPGGFGANDIYVSRRKHTHDDFGWETPQNLGSGVNTDANEASPAISQNDETGMTTLYFDSNRPGGFGPFSFDGAGNGNDIYASMLQQDGTFGPAGLVAELSTEFFDRQPTISRDGRELYFSSDRPGGSGALDLWVSTRETPWDSWSPPVVLPPPINSTTNDAGPELSFEGRALYFQLTPPGSGSFDLHITTRTKLNGNK